MWIFKAALFIQIQNWRQATCLLTDEWIIKLCYICTMEYYSAIKKLIQGTTWVNIKHIMFFKVYNVTVLLFSQSCVSIISATFRTLQYVPAPSPKKLGPFSCHPPPNLHLSVFVPLEICLFWKFHINGVKQYMTFCYWHLSVQFSLVAQSCLTLCNLMNRSTPGLPVHHQLLESTQTHVHQVGDVIKSSHLLSSPSPPALSLSQHPAYFQASCMMWHVSVTFAFLFLNNSLLYWYTPFYLSIH